MNWLAYQFHILAPFWLRDSWVGWILLPYAGNWEYSNTNRESAFRRLVGRERVIERNVGERL